MMILGLGSARFSCTHCHASDRFHAFRSAVHSLVWFFGPSPQYSRLIPQPVCLSRSYIVVRPVLGQPFTHEVVHHSSVAIAL